MNQPNQPSTRQIYLKYPTFQLEEKSSLDPLNVNYTKIIYRRKSCEGEQFGINCIKVKQLNFLYPKFTTCQSEKLKKDTQLAIQQTAQKQTNRRKKNNTVDLNTPILNVFGCMKKKNLHFNRSNNRNPFEKINCLSKLLNFDITDQLKQKCTKVQNSLKQSSQSYSSSDSSFVRQNSGIKIQSSLPKIKIQLEGTIQQYRLSKNKTLDKFLNFKSLQNIIDNKENCQKQKSSSLLQFNFYHNTKLNTKSLNNQMMPYSNKSHRNIKYSQQQDSSRSSQKFELSCLEMRQQQQVKMVSKNHLSKGKLSNQLEPKIIQKSQRKLFYIL